jgi:hypothetical protein
VDNSNSTSKAGKQALALQSRIANNSTSKPAIASAKQGCQQQQQQSRDTSNSTSKAGKPATAPAEQGC